MSEKVSAILGLILLAGAVVYYFSGSAGSIPVGTGYPYSQSVYFPAKEGAIPTVAITPTNTPEATATVAYKSQLTREEMIAVLVAVGFPDWAIEPALKVSWCESRWSPGATGSAGERGLFQIHPGYHSDSTWDVIGNVQAAYRISGGGASWWAWSCKP